MNHTKYSNKELKSALEALTSMHGVTPEMQHSFDVAADVIRSNIWEPLYENDEWNYPEDGSVVRIETGFDRRAEVAVFMKEYDLDGFTYTNSFVGPSGETVVRYSLDAEWQYAPECEKEIKFLREAKEEAER